MLFPAFPTTILLVQLAYKYNIAHVLTLTVCLAVHGGEFMHEANGGPETQECNLRDSDLIRASKLLDKFGNFVALFWVQGLTVESWRTVLEKKKKKKELIL